MRQLFCVILSLCVIVSQLYADAVYLKNGKYIKGKIVEEQNNTVMIETDSGEWKKIAKDEIDTIRKEDIQKKPAISQKQVVPENKPYDYNNGVEKGYEGAKEFHESKNWAVGSFVVGGLFGLIGTSVMTAISAATTPTVVEDDDTEKKSPLFRNGYHDGYLQKAKNSNWLAALIGGLVGTGVGYLIVKESK